MSIEAALACYQRGEFAEALRRADSIIAVAPSIAMSWRFRAECLFALGRFEEAADSYARALQIGGPGTEDLPLWRALSIFNAGDAETAKTLVRAFLAEPAGTHDPALDDRANDLVRAFLGKPRPPR